MKKQLCGLFLTGVFIAFGAYALAGPTQQQGVAGLSRVAAAMSDICHECCVTEDSCTIDQCQAEAAAIQAALINTWNANFGKGSNSSRDEVGGYLCWDWAKFFQDAAQATNPKCWTVSGGMAVTTASHAVHYWVDFDACPGNPNCRVSVDDGWFDGGFAHTPPWPVGGTWSRGNLPRPPAGRAYTPPKPPPSKGASETPELSRRCSRWALCS